jgi:lipopolysaccharide/colanic/teichoic acid biosynthesis glycosyltransferase
LHMEEGARVTHVQTALPDAVTMESEGVQPPVAASLATSAKAHSRGLRKQAVPRRKRVLDIALAGALLILLSPVLALVALTIWLTDGGPVLYRQTRVGLRTRPFVLYKFRTMVDGADGRVDQVFHLNHANGPFFKAKDDPRLTRVGRLLRRAFLDELPQLFNVIKGDMSLVGPRPCLPSELNVLNGALAFRFSVPQGITGPWQVNGYHGLTLEEQLRVEREYIESWTISRDIIILLQTVPLVLRRKGI